MKYYLGDKFMIRSEYWSQWVLSLWTGPFINPIDTIFTIEVIDEHEIQLSCVGWDEWHGLTLDQLNDKFVPYQEDETS